MIKKLEIAIALLVFLIASQCNALGALVVTLSPNSNTYAPGDSGILNVFVSGTNEQLDSYLFGINIQGGAGVEFAVPQSESFLSDSQYVFVGRSNSFIQNIPATVVALGLDSVLIGDLSDDGMGDPDPYQFINDQRLLAQLEFNAVGTGTYEFTIDATSSFSDAASQLIDYIPSSATINVTAVPEPTCLAFWVGGLGLYLGRRFKRKT